MSTRPTIPAPRWDTNGTNAAPPASGRILDGYGTSAPLPSSDLNYNFRGLGEWVKHFADGDVALTDLKLGGLVLGTTTANLPNATTFNLDLTGGTASGYLAIRLTGGGTSAIVTGISATDATEGRVFVLLNSTGNAFTISVEDTGSLAANRILSANAAPGSGISVPNGGLIALRYDATLPRWVVAFANFGIDFAPRITNYPAMVGREIGAPLQHVLSVNKWTTGTSANNIDFAVPLSPLQTITSWVVYVNKTTSAAATISANLWRVDPTNGTTVAIGAYATSAAGAPGFIQLATSGLSEVCLAGFNYYLRFAPVSSAAGDEVYGVRIVTTRQ
jgi:hypothetical protein